MRHPALMAEVRSMLALATPLSLIFLGQVAIGAIDTIMIGRLGYEVLAGTALSLNIYLLLSMIAIGLIVAATPLLARAASANEVDQLRHCMHHSWLLAGGVSAALSLALGWVGPLLLLLGQQPALVATGVEYMEVMRWSLIPAMLMIATRNLFSSLQSPLPALVVMGVAVLLNILLNYLLIFGYWGFPAMGVRGAATASILVNLFMVISLTLIIAIRPTFRRYQLFSRGFDFDPALLIRLLRIGGPISLAFLLEEGLFSVTILLMGFFDSASVAAHQIAIQVGTVTYMFILGIGNAATVRVGSAMGQRNPLAVARSGWIAIALGASVMLLLALFIWSFPQLIIALFLDSLDPANTRVIELASGFLVVLAIFQVMDGIQLTAVGALHGFPDTRIPMLMGALSFWGVGVGLAVVLGFVLDWRGIGIWIGLASGLGLMALLSSWRFYRLSHHCERYFERARELPVT
ncbi:MATE family efflux transporter [Aestuariirhabdus litorea]|uniref:Multidrug-efflux transporter n=1 Tax=Aestuariirhabdus litorea TaxID=2528527 RepID=A0A3P3VPK8_9GAMM|nr:MATE family efflux transporter [Aestuariirhabdus litorea]RRJ84307.1 MATE family efflux transporter [Aestuariirhabdus litorea]RWW97530.1 MATE family efflux transporter [Endozoicomonadaceae bacterium GTF-13]